MKFFSRRHRKPSPPVDAYDHYRTFLCLPFSFRRWFLRLFDNDTPPLPPSDRLSLALALAEQYVIDTQSLEDETASSHHTVTAMSVKDVSEQQRGVWRPRTISNGSTAYESFVEKPKAVEVRLGIKVANSSPAGALDGSAREVRNPRQWVQNLFV